MARSSSTEMKLFWGVTPIDSSPRLSTLPWMPMATRTRPQGTSTSPVAGFHPEDGGVAVPVEGEGPCPRHNVDALSPQGPLQQLAYLRVLVGQQLRHHLNDGHVDAIGVVDRCKLDAYGASAEDHGIGGQIRLLQGLAAGDDDLLVDGQNGEGTGPGARGDDNVFGGYHSIVGGYPNAVGVDEAGFADHVVDAVLPQQMGDAAHHPVDDAAAALDGLGVVDGEVIEGHAELPGPVK